MFFDLFLRTRVNKSQMFWWIILLMFLCQQLYSYRNYKSICNDSGILLRDRLCAQTSGLINIGLLLSGNSLIYWFASMNWIEWQYTRYQSIINQQTLGLRINVKLMWSLIFIDWAYPIVSLYLIILVTKDF